MENIDERLMQEIQELGNIEFQYSMLLFSKFNRVLDESYKSKIEAIEKNIDSQIEYYGKTVDEYRNKKDEIVNKYKNEFQRIYNQRKEQFVNIEVEINEIQANQKIAIANFKKIIEDKNKFLKTSQYDEYLKKKKRYKHIVDTTLNHAEFDKYEKLLADLRDPLEMYQVKLEAVVNKYNGYTELIEQCEAKLLECIDAAQAEFEEIVKYRNVNLAKISKENIISKLINKILNKFLGTSKLEKEVIGKMQAELVNVEKSNNEIIDVIGTQTIAIVAKIEEVRDVLNQEFKVAIG